MVITRGNSPVTQRPAAHNLRQPAPATTNAAAVAHANQRGLTASQLEAYLAQMRMTPVRQPVQSESESSLQSDDSSDEDDDE
jgi:nucleoid-associated protein YgaU